MVTDSLYGQHLFFFLQAVYYLYLKTKLNLKNKKKFFIRIWINENKKLNLIKKKKNLKKKFYQLIKFILIKSKNNQHVKQKS